MPIAAGYTPERSPLKRRIPPLFDPRQNVLGRLLVQRFQDIVADNDEAAGHNEKVPRGILPGIFEFVRQILGDETIAAYREICRQQIVGCRQMVGAGKGKGGLRQDLFVREPSSMQVIEDILTALALHVGHAGLDAGSLAQILNENAENAENARRAGGIANDGNIPLLRNRTCARMLSKLFVDLRDALSTDIGRHRLIERHGSETCVKLWLIVSSLAEDAHLAGVPRDGAELQACEDR